MAVTNPWLGDKMPTQKLDPERLEDHTLNLLCTHNMGVLATTVESGPLVTVVTGD